jgi:hypothetical protein
MDPTKPMYFERVVVVVVVSFSDKRTANLTGSPY